MRRYVDSSSHTDPHRLRPRAEARGLSLLVLRARADGRERAPHELMQSVLRRRAFASPGDHRRLRSSGYAGLPLRHRGGDRSSRRLRLRDGQRRRLRGAGSRSYGWSSGLLRASSKFGGDRGATVDGASPGSSEGSPSERRTRQPGLRGGSALGAAESLRAEGGLRAMGGSTRRPGRAGRTNGDGRRPGHPAGELIDGANPRRPGRGHDAGPRMRRIE